MFSFILTKGPEAWSRWGNAGLCGESGLIGRRRWCRVVVVVRLIRGNANVWA